MRRLATTFLLVFTAWLILTYTLHPESVVAGIIISLTITFISRHLLARDTPRIILHPMRWLGLIIYTGFMIWAETKAHIDVASRVLTGRVRPAIVEVPVHFKTNLGKTLIGNSITITPGTLTLNADKSSKFYIHTIGYDKKTDIAGPFHKYGRKVIE